MKKNQLLFSLLLGVLPLTKTTDPFSIKEVNASNTVATVDNTLIDTYNKAGNYITGKVGVYSKIDSLSDLSDIKDSGEKPTSVIFNVNKDMELVDSSNNSLNISIKEAYDTYLKDCVIPIVYVDNDEEATSFIDYHKYTFNMIDMAVISSSFDSLKKVRDSINNIRGILDCSNVNFTSKKELGDVVNKANACCANSIILNEETATEEAVYYIQARFKTVLINQVNKTSKMDVISMYCTGAYGILCDNYHDIYNAYKILGTSPIKTKNLVRRPYNIAHRGLCVSSYENSLESFELAYQNGATHIEIDMQITKDSKIVIMHDDTLDRTTNFKKVSEEKQISSSKNKISDYTLEELKQFKITKNYGGMIVGEGDDIPSLDDVFKAFKDKDIVIICELKIPDSRLCSLFKTYLDNYDMYDQVVAISFYTSQLKTMKSVLPEIPTSDLNDYKYDDGNPSIFINSLTSLNSLNTNCDTNKYYDSNGLKRYLSIRGYSIWLWTYENYTLAESAIKSGTLGITTNQAEKLKDVAIRITDNSYLASTNDDISEEVFKVKCKTFGGVSEYTVDAKAICYEDCGKYYKAILCAQYSSPSGSEYVIYSNQTIIIKNSYYVSIDSFNEIINKDIKEYSEDDISLLNKVKDNIDVIALYYKENIDINTIDKKIEDYNNYQKEEPINNQSGCNSNASNAFLIGGIILLFLIIKKKYYEKKY